MAVLVLVLLAIWLFRGHFFGQSLWIGNPDRLNSDLKVLAHYLSGVSAGHISAWNEHEMMGYDSFVLPYTFPNPVVYLVALFGGRTASSRWATCDRDAGKRRTRRVLASSAPGCLPACRSLWGRSATSSPR